MFHTQILAESRTQVIERLRTHVETTLEDLLPSGATFALLDVPDHDNVGDSAIFMGERAYLERRGMRASVMTSYRQPACEDAHIGEAIGDGVILLHGGGNFGDLWPQFQAYRERIMAAYPGRPMVQMPQSLHYQSPAHLERTARAIEQQGRFTLLVRDYRSLELATRHFQCEVRLCPDMAFCMGDLSGQTEGVVPRHDLLLHLRMDQEAAVAHDLSCVAGVPGMRRADWPREPNHFMLRTKLETVFLAGLQGNVFEGKDLLKERFFARQGAVRLARGTALLRSGRRVITDRLHGHILSLLLGLPHVVLDNSYGKTSAFMHAWGTQAGSTYTAESLEEAAHILSVREGLRLAPACAA
jgi:exopolysaccharide biosynthesis predicted pyruvyltransferase EpsI